MAGAGSADTAVTADAWFVMTMLSLTKAHHDHNHLFHDCLSPRWQALQSARRATQALTAPPAVRVTECLYG